VQVVLLLVHQGLMQVMAQTPYLVQLLQRVGAQAVLKAHLLEMAKMVAQEVEHLMQVQEVLHLHQVKDLVGVMEELHLHLIQQEAVVELAQLDWLAIL
jgi:hypothetical protein